MALGSLMESKVADDAGSEETPSAVHLDHHDVDKQRLSGADLGLIWCNLSDLDIGQLFGTGVGLYFCASLARVQGAFSWYRCLAFTPSLSQSSHNGCARQSSQTSSSLLPMAFSALGHLGWGLQSCCSAQIAVCSTHSRA